MSRSNRAWTKALFIVIAMSVFAIGVPPAVARADSAGGLHSKPSTTDSDQRSTTVHGARGVVLALWSGYSSRSTAARVRALQLRLANAGCAPGPVDGLYGPLTEQAVMRFQAEHGLQVDGIAGPLTLGRLRTHTPKQVARVPNTAPSHHSGKRSSSPGHPRPQTAHHQPAHANPPTAVRTHSTNPPTAVRTHSTSSAPLGWIAALLIGLAAGVVLAAMTLAGWRRYGRSAGAPQVRAEADGLFREALALEEDGHVSEALEAYRQSDRLGHPSAPSNLGVLLEEHGDRAQAEACYRRADHRGDPVGAVNLALLLEEKGDDKGAQEAYERADQLGHGTAAANLGVLLGEQGDRLGGLVAYRRAHRRADEAGERARAGARAPNSKVAVRTATEHQGCQP